MSVFSEIEEIVVESDFFEFGCIDVTDLKFYPEIRKICEGNSCRNYATSWACPPAVGTVEECRERVNQYQKMMLFSAEYELEDSFDFDGMAKAIKDFKRMVDSFSVRIGNVLNNYLLLSNEGCGRCTECTYPDAPCRFPDMLHHSLEGYGFIVSELAQMAGVSYNNGVNTVTFFGALLYGEIE